MADSEKSKSPTGEAQAKMSLLDDDFSKDLFSSWKSNGDDMDFNFEPVSKGKKKAFDFGMEMDFSLDDDFGKMSSFKMDMGDLDFSSSPKKSTKSKEKSEEDSAKGNRSEKHDKFNFSFDFNGLDDFSLDVPSSIVKKSNTKKKDSGCEDLPRQVTDDKRKATNDIISKEPSVGENAAPSKSEGSMVANGEPETPSENCAMESTLLRHPVQPEETFISSDMEVSENTQKIDHQSYLKEETSSEILCSTEKEGKLDLVPVSKTTQSISSPMVVESAEVLMDTDDNMQLKEETTSNQPHVQLKETDLSANIPVVEASTQVSVLEEVDISSLDRELNDGSSEARTVIGELPAAVVLTSDNEKLVEDKSSLQCSIEKMNISDEKSELGDSGSLCSAKLPVVTGKPSSSNDINALSSSARSFTGVQKPALKVSPVPSGSVPNAANTFLLRNKVPRALNLKFPAIQVKNDGRTGISAFKDNGGGSTQISSLEKSYGKGKHSGKVTAGNQSSCNKKFIKQDSVLEETEKNHSVDTTQSNLNSTVKGIIGNAVSVDSMRDNGKTAKDGLLSLDSEKIINNVKSSGFKTPSSAPSEEGTKSSSQWQEIVKNKISGIASIQKLNIGQGNKLSSQRTDKKMSALPGLKPTRTTTTDKHPVTPNTQGFAKPLGEFEKRSRLQASFKNVSPVFAEKQTPLTPSLKRKPSEAADMDPSNLRTSKRASPSESRYSNQYTSSRMSKVSSKELEKGEGVHAQGNFSQGSGKNVTTECMTPKFDFYQEAKIEALQFSLMVENDANVEKAEACAKELDNICNMLKKKHEEAKELLVRALVNNNNLLMLNHPIYDEKISAVLKFASRLTSKELEIEA